MLNALLGLARPALLALEPERAHELTLTSLERGIYPRPSSADPLELSTRVMGLDFPNPIGVAPGFDKDARVPDQILRMGFGFAEIGTVTPLPQAGNPKPRVFRLINERAVINRLGFNNEGHAAALARLRRRDGSGIVGINVGANKDAPDRIADYVTGLDAFWDVASYFTVNISSPNTPGLRDMQAPAALDELLGRVMEARSRHVAAGRPSRPIVVKLAPDVAEDDIAPIAARLLAHAVDGIAISNTTLTRPGLSENPTGREAGGLSGRPLFHRSTVMLARFYSETGGKVPLIGLGGVESAETARAKFEAGASLIQLYTALIYEGPSLLTRIKDGLSAAVRETGATSVTALIGRKAGEWAARPVDPPA